MHDKFRVDKSYLARIPAGAYDGMKIRLQRAGKPLEAGGSGNVLLGILILHDSIPDAYAFAGILIILAGMTGNSLLA